MKGLPQEHKHNSRGQDLEPLTAQNTNLMRKTAHDRYPMDVYISVHLQLVNGSPGWLV